MGPFWWPSWIQPKAMPVSVWKGGIDEVPSDFTLLFWNAIEWCNAVWITMSRKWTYEKLRNNYEQVHKPFLLHMFPGVQLFGGCEMLIFSILLGLYNHIEKCWRSLTMRHDSSMLDDRVMNIRHPYEVYSSVHSITLIFHIISYNHMHSIGSPGHSI